MKVLFFGIYDPAYSRNKVLQKGFRECGYDVVDCRVAPSCGFLRKFWLLYKRGKVLRDTSFEYVIVAFPGHTVVWLARLFFGQRIIFDAFVSLYNSNVEDRQLYRPLHPRAWWDWFLDWSSCLFAETVLLDTNAHIDYFRKKFHLHQEKFIRVFVGAAPCHGGGALAVAKKNRGQFIVHFHGTYIPLQGIEYIVQAAKLLERDPSIHFRIIGSGQTHAVIQVLQRNLGSSNIEWLGRVPYNELMRLQDEADMALGIFGPTTKAAMVIPNKVFEAATAGKAVLTEDSPAIRELFTHGKNIFLCAPADPTALAKGIRTLRDDATLRAVLGRNARALSVAMFSPRHIVAGLLQALRK